MKKEKKKKKGGGRGVRMMTVDETELHNNLQKDNKKV